MRIPILPFENILVASIQVDLTDHDVLQFQQDVLQKVDETDAEGLVIDITALDVVDSFMARVINDTAQMTHVVGAKVVLCGMQPSVALTLTEMGRQLVGVETALNLNHGVAKVQRLVTEREAGDEQYAA